MKRCVCVFASLLGLAACHSQTQPAASTAPPVEPDQPAAQVPAVADSPGAAYRVYRALLPGQADSVTLHLVSAPQPLYDMPGTSRYGSYYGPDGHPYEVQSRPSAPDSVVLNDIGLEHSTNLGTAAGVWRLRPQPDGSLAGTAGGQPVRLRLMATPAGSFTFAVRYFADSLAAYPKDAANSPKAHINLQALVPVGGPAAVQQALQASIGRDLRGDTLGTLPVVALPALFRQQRDTFFKDYRTDVGEMMASSSPDERPSAMLNYTEQDAIHVLCQQGSLLSLGFFNYTYSGGAHGMNTTALASYDLRTGRRLRYDDIFRPTAQAQLPALLSQAVRKLTGIEPNEPLDKQLFMKQMPVTHNVFLAPGGVVLGYQPYEIASYAQGEIRVFLPFSAVRALLREGLPLPATGTVAAR